jgi:RNA polymerase sigma-70 factor (ECF subfamily)
VVDGVADTPDTPSRRAQGPRTPSTGRGFDPADELIIERVAGGDQRALGELYDRWARPAYSLARRVCADDVLAEDVVQEAFLAFWREPDRFNPTRGAFSTWLLTLVHHKAVDAVRRESAIRRRTVPAPEDGDDWSMIAGPGADHDALGAVVAGQVREALCRLPNEQREALALAYYGGYTQREVATLTGVPLGTVKSRMFTGVQRLRSVLGPLLGEVATDFGGGAR